MDDKSLLLVITFHSLEERIVSQFFSQWRKEKLGQMAVKKPLAASAEELAENSASRSARLYGFMF